MRYWLIFALVVGLAGAAYAAEVTGSLTIPGVTITIPDDQLPAGPQGPQGEQGPAGADGAPGSAGVPGADGCSLLRGAGDPAPELGKDCDSYISDSGFLWGPKVGGEWGNPIDLRSQASVEAPTYLNHLQAAISPIACQGDVTSAIQAAWDARKIAVLGYGDCNYTTVRGFDGGIKLIGMGPSSTNGTGLHFKGSGPSIELKPGQGGMSAAYIAGIKFYDEGTGDPTKRHAIAIDGCSNNSVIEYVDFRGFHDQIHLEAALSDNSAAFRCHIRDVFSFHARGCMVRVSKDPARPGWPLTYIRLENFDGGRAKEAGFCFDHLSSTSTAVVISGGICEDDTDSGGILMPVCIKVKSQFPNQPFATFVLEGIDSWSDTFFQSNVPVKVNLIGNNFVGNPAKPTFCRLAIDLPGTANDVTCQAAHGANVSR